MNSLRKKIFSGNYNAEKKNGLHQPPHDIYCESQNVSVLKEGKKVEHKKKRFIANYNMFF